MQKVVLVDVIDPHTHKDDAVKNLSELRSLVETMGGIAIVSVIQHRTHPDSATFIGSGKVMELAQIVQEKHISIVIVNAIVNSATLFRLTQKLWGINPNIKVWDRIDLILNIFDKHAKTAESKLQIEIARMHHMGPRMYGLGGTLFSRQGGGIGTKGLGETNVELMKRHWRNQIKTKTEQLKNLSQHREAQLARRRENGLKTVSIIGYTNAGKTSLFNLLTKRKKEVKNALFVTLDSSVGKVFLPNLKTEILVSDTIGFIQNLPPSLFESFKSTLLESVHADLLIHVVDMTDKKLQEKIDTVEQILTDLGIISKKRIIVFNKIDAVLALKTKVRQLNKIHEFFDPQFISVNMQAGIPKLLATVEKQLMKKSHFD